MQKFCDKISTIKSKVLKPHDLKILQVNVGCLCNMSCVHCHVFGGPAKTENMNKETAEQVVRILKENQFERLDITGGAPEMNPLFRMLVAEARKTGCYVTVRTNLTIFFEEGMEGLPEYYRDWNVDLIASMPCYLEDNVERMRGNGVFTKSINALRRLNKIGYGRELSGLRLDLAYNPQGMSFAPPQCALEADYKRELQKRYGITFNRLYVFANMPIGRFREFLVRTGNLEKYEVNLANAFNPATLDGIMCRHLISVDWNGQLHECDFNLALGLATDADAPQSISRFDYDALLERKINVAEHCYGCTAGQGSS
jgi:radical SAM/Cys-rich protein